MPEAIDSGTPFCEKRGIRELKKCIHCGAELPDDAKACGNCGWPVGKPDTASAANPEIPRVSGEVPSEDGAAGAAEKDNPSADIDKAVDPERQLETSNASAGDSEITDRTNTPAAGLGMTERTNTPAAELEMTERTNTPAEDLGMTERTNTPAADSEITETKNDGSADQTASAAADAHRVVWDKEDSEDKIDIPWDPEEADRKKAEAKNGGGESASVHAGGFGSDRDTFRGGNQEKESDQPGGYWFQGKWHPISDLNSGETDNKKVAGSGDGRYWENGTWHDASSAGNFVNNRDDAQNSRSADGDWSGNGSNSGNSGNGWNGRNAEDGWKNGDNRGWNAGNPNGGWPGNQGYGSYGQGYGPGYPARNNSFAVAAMALAIVSIFLNSLYCIPSVLGIFFAIVALNQIRNNPGVYKGKGMAIAALIMCMVLFVVYLIAFIEVAKLMRDPAFMKQIEDYLKQLQGGTSSSAGQAAAAFWLR